MNPLISHDRKHETIEAKAMWFQSLSLQERMEMLCAFTEFILLVNPGIVEQKHVRYASGSVRVLSKA